MKHALSVAESAPDSGLTLLLVDKHVIVRHGLRLLLSAQPGWSVIGEAGSAGEALALTRACRPDVVVIDPALSNERDVDLIPQLVAGFDDLRIIVLTAVHDNELHERAISFGAKGLVLKE